MKLLRPTLFALLFFSVAGCNTGDSDDAPVSSVDKSFPSDWHFIQRTFPFYQADKFVYRDALDTIERKKRSAKQAPGSWDFEGPSNVGGRIVDIEFDPLRPDTVYAGAATGGVLKSVDGGISWLPVFDDQNILTVGDIAVDPVNSDIVYVGTGEANGGHNNFAGGGLFKSVDAGTSWQLSGLVETTSIGRVIVDRENHDRIFVAAVGSYFSPDPDRGVYRSDNAGASWEKVLFVNDSTGVIDIAQKPDDADVLLAATWERVRRPEGSVFLYGNSSGIYRSADGGESWQELGFDNGLPDPATLQDGTGRTQIGRIGLSFSESSPDLVYALYTDGFTIIGLYRSFDAGLAWSRVDSGSQVTGISAGFGFSWYFGQVRVDPADPNHVFVLDGLIGRSTNGSNTWSSTSGTHVDYHALAFDPSDPDRILAGNDGGIAISTSGGSSWIPVNGLPITQFYEINFDASNPDRLVGGTQDNGTWLKEDGTWDFIFGGDGFYSILDPTDPNYIYAESQNGNFARSTNGGASFIGATNGISSTEKRNWSTPAILDPHDPTVLYFGTDKIYRSTNRAGSWSPVSPVIVASPQGSRLGSVTTIAVAPSDANTIYAGTDDGKVWTTQDYGDIWTDVTAGLPRRWVTRVAVSETDPQTAYVTFSGLKWRDPQPHIFRTRNAGATWEDISSDLPDLPINALALDAFMEDIIYVGTDIGAFVTEDGGLSWSVLGDGLPAVPVYDLKYVKSTMDILAGTHGRSMYRLDVTQLSTAIDNNPVPLAGEVSVYPNPFSSSVNIEIPTHAQPMDVTIYDLMGRRVWFSDDVRGPIVTIDVTTRESGLSASGVYLIRITESGNSELVVAEGSVLRVR
ncbi:MAG: T9SS type A sorting domain-containing protein [Rhodothermales bacterium]|nr:T9SS type A sorting domain-containing protein [Rhodothermales bacterium]